MRMRQSTEPVPFLWVSLFLTAALVVTPTPLSEEANIIGGLPTPSRAALPTLANPGPALIPVSVAEIPHTSNGLSGPKLESPSPIDLLPEVPISPLPTTTPIFDDVPSLDAFIASVVVGDSESPVGLWADGLMALRIVEGHDNDVPSTNSTASTYGWALDHGVLGLLIHDYLGGSRIYQLNRGNRIALILGDGSVEWYVSQDSVYYESLGYSSAGFTGPFRLWSCFACPYDQSVNELQWRHYAGEPHLAIQTCYKTDNRIGLVIVEAYREEIPGGFSSVTLDPPE